MTEFPIGTRVILQNLTKGTEYNGKIGIIQSVLTDKGRQLVSIIGSNKNHKKGGVLGLKPSNLRYEPRTIKSLTIRELKTVLREATATTSEDGGSTLPDLQGMDKTQLIQLVQTTVPSEETIAQLLANAPTQDETSTTPPPTTTTAQTTSDHQLRAELRSQASQIASTSPSQLRSQAQMLRSMDKHMVRRMNPAMKGFTDAQIDQAADRMEMMANHPEMVRGMARQMENMSNDEMEALKRMRDGAGGGATAAGGGAGSPPSPVNINPQSQMQAGLQTMSNLTPEQLRQQATMMKSMDPTTLRQINPAMANWSDAQIQMAVQQMETMANNPDMMKTMTEQMKSMSPEDIQKMQTQAFASGGVGGGGTMEGVVESTTTDGTNNHNPMMGSQDPMQMLQNADPKQIKQMLRMVKDNPELMKTMLKSTNPGMGSNISDEQISKTMEMFANMDEKNIEKMMKIGNYVHKAREYMRGKGVFVILSLVVLCYAVIAYVVSRRGSVSIPDLEHSSQEESIPVIMEDEFAETEL